MLSARQYGRAEGWRAHAPLRPTPLTLHVSPKAGPPHSSPHAPSRHSSQGAAAMGCRRRQSAGWPPGHLPGPAAGNVQRQRHCTGGGARAQARGARVYQLQRSTRAPKVAGRAWGQCAGRTPLVAPPVAHLVVEGQLPGHVVIHVLDLQRAAASMAGLEPGQATAPGVLLHAGSGSGCGAAAAALRPACARTSLGSSCVMASVSSQGAPSAHPMSSSFSCMASTS